MLIGLTGKKGSGKTTAAEYLSYKYSIKQVSFADPIKQISKIMGFTELQVNGSQDDKNTHHPFLPITARHFMQQFGTDFARQTICDDIWIRILNNYIQSENYDNVIIADVRFTNEFEYIRDSGGWLINIIRPSSASDNHISECEQDIFTQSPTHRSSIITIYNDSTIQNLYTELDNAIKHINTAIV